MSRCKPRLSVDQAFDVLASSRRRRLLRLLLSEADPPVYRDELSDRLAEEVSMAPATIETALAHHHLPKLADMGVIEYDHRSGAIRPAEGAEELEPLLEVVWERWEAPQE